MNFSKRRQSLKAGVLAVLLGAHLIGATIAQAQPHAPANTPDVNLWALAMEVTQATQPWLAVALNHREITPREITVSPESIPLVRGKRTVARVYPGLEGTSQAMIGVEATLACQGANAAPCPGPAVVQPANVIQVEPADDRDLEAMRADAARSWNFVLPAEWTATGAPIRLTAAITAPAGMPECPVCHDGANRLVVSGLQFNSTASLKLKVVYACVRRYPDDPAAKCDHAPLDIHERLFHEGSLLALAFPIALEDIHISLHEPVTVTVDGDYRTAGGPMTAGRMREFHRLVCALARGSAEAPPPANEITIGIVPFPTMGVFGLGSDNCIIVRAGLGILNQAMETIAEEIGHALGRPHAGCDVHPPGEDAPCEPTYQQFPCPHGGVCTPGFDTHTLQAIGVGDPAGEHAHDFMSYGGGVQWISPYTYRHLYDALRALAE